MTRFSLATCAVLALGCADAEALDASVVDTPEVGTDAALLDGPPPPPPLDVPKGPPTDAVELDGPVDAAMPVDVVEPDVPTPDGPLPDGPAPDGPQPDGPIADAAPDMAPDAPGCVPEAEVCDGVDNDCDEAVDEGATCANFVEDQCRVFFGQADDNQQPRGAVPVWGDCPAADRDFAGEVRCTGTRPGRGFALFQPEGDLDGNDHLAVALICADAEHPLVAAYIQAHCAVFMGYADRDRGPDDALTWGACPNAIQGNAGELRCTSSGFDGQFRAMPLSGDVDDNDDLGWAWICRDAIQPERAAGLQSSVALYVGWADNRRGPADGSPGWGPCPANVAGERDGQRCTSTRGDGRFHRLDLGGDVDDNDEMGFLLIAR